MSDLIDRQAVLDAFGLSEKTRKYGGDHSGYDTIMLYEIQNIIEDLPSITPTDDDYISRQAVLDIVIWEKPQQMITKVLELPSVTPTEMKSYIDNCGNIFTYPTERTGRWIYIGNTVINHSLKICECDKCHKRSYGSVKYCPNCGCRMQESEE